LFSKKNTVEKSIQSSCILIGTGALASKSLIEISSPKDSIKSSASSPFNIRRVDVHHFSFLKKGVGAMLLLSLFVCLQIGLGRCPL
jgi:hypothetical protein